MAHPSRRRILQAMLVASAAATWPRFVLGQESRVRTVAGNGIAGYEYEGSAGLLAAETSVNNPYGVVIGLMAPCIFAKLSLAESDA